MTFETKQAYLEVYTVLQYLPEEYVKMIPKKVLNLFRTEKLENYEVNIDKENPIDKNKLKRKTMVILAMLNYHYWCPNRNVKNQLFTLYFLNNNKYQKK